MGYILLEVTINPTLEPVDPKAWSPQVKQPMGRKRNSTHQQIIGLKFNCPLEQDPGGSGVKVSPYNVGELGSIPVLGRSPGEGNGNPLQFSSLENLMDGGGWWATVHGVTKSWTQLSNFSSVQSKTQFFPQPVPPIRKLTQVS